MRFSKAVKTRNPTPAQPTRCAIRLRAASREAPGGIATGQVMGDQTIQQGAPVGHVTLSLDDYEARQKKLRAEVEAEMEGKCGEERAGLQARLDEEPPPCRPGRGPEGRGRADRGTGGCASGTPKPRKNRPRRTALEAGDFETAREMFERLEARTAPDVTKNADAHFALGQIAEIEEDAIEIRWADAAGHYARAAGLRRTFDTLYKARGSRGGQDSTETGARSGRPAGLSRGDRSGDCP